MEKMKTYRFFLLPSIVASLLQVVGCVRDIQEQEKENPGGSRGIVLPYTATVTGGTGGSGRATLDNEKHYRFEDGDVLVITGTDISGTLTLTEGAGETSATFEGELTYTGEGDPSPDLELKAFLEGPANAMTSLSYDAAEYPNTAVAASLAEAVRKYSHFKAVSTYGAKTFSLSQKSAFLNFNLTFENAVTAGQVLDFQVANYTSSGVDRRIGSVTVASSGSGITAQFVAVFPGGTELSGAYLSIGSNFISFGGSTVLVSNKIYNIKKTLLPVEGLKAVDLGLSSGTLWANVNLDDYSDAGYGTYYAWGETTGYSYAFADHVFNWANYSLGDGSVFTKYNGTDNKSVLEAVDDAATVQWGGLWRMPTAEEFEELMEGTQTRWESDYQGYSGYMCTSKADASNAIFLTAAGMRDGSGNSYVDSQGHYWTASLFPSDDAYAYHMYFFNGGYSGTATSRYIGYRIRPVYARKKLVAVDLGLPSGTKWANMNIGAEDASQYGLMFAWGETTGYSSTDNSDHTFSWDYYLWNPSHDGQTFTKYSKDDQSPGDGKDTLEPEDDAATVIWGKPWMMPTNADFVELIDGTDQSWIDNYNGTGISGVKFVSKAAGNTNYIFLPAVGARANAEHFGAGSEGYYWASSLNNVAQQGRALYFSSSAEYTIQTVRSFGLSVRPVAKTPAGAGVEDYDIEDSQIWK